METKSSRMSQKSVTGQAPPVAKSMSKASLSPSQMSERTRSANAAATTANRDPLNALSRAGPRINNPERRCGLQDVDDEYLKTVVYGFAKQTGQNATERFKVTAEMQPAGIPTARNRGGEQPQQQRKDSIAAIIQDPVPSQSQVQSPPPAAQAQSAASSSPPPSSTTQAKQSQPTSPSQDANPPEKPQSTQQQPQQQQKSAGGGAERQAGGSGGGSGEPEMYTTCPNCRATLYLVRNAGEQSPYSNQSGDANQAPSQSQVPAAQQQK